MGCFLERVVSHLEHGGTVLFPYLGNSKLGNYLGGVPIGNIRRPGMSSGKAEPNTDRKRGTHSENGEMARD